MAHRRSWDVPLWIDAEGLLAPIMDVSMYFQPDERGAHYLPVRFHLSDGISIYWCRRRCFGGKEIHVAEMFNCLDME